MSIKDYTKYAKTPEVVTEKVEEISEEPIFVPNAVAEPAVEEEVVDNLPTESEPKPEAVKAYKTGSVYGCAKLNVRNAPKPDAGIICEIPCNTEVEIDEDASEGNFYKIYTASGIEGFCMKSYILEK